MQVLVSIFTDPAGNRNVRVTLISLDGQLQVTAFMDAPSSRAVAANLKEYADKLDRRVVTIDAPHGCPACSGELPEYAAVPMLHLGTWVHHSLEALGQWFTCMTPPDNTRPSNTA